MVRAPLREARTGRQADRPACDVPSPGHRSGLDAVVALATAAEAAGFEGLYLDGSAGRLDAVTSAAVPVDPFVVLGAVAVSTTRLHLGCLASPLDERPPALLAKTVTSLDVCSDGRAILVLTPDPALASAGGTMERLGEALEVCRALVRVSAPSFSGHFYQLDHAWNEPRLASGARPTPLLGLSVPAGADQAVRRGLLDLAARFTEQCIVEAGADSEPAGEVAELLEELTPLAHRAGRVPGSLRVVVRLPAGHLGAEALAARVRSVLDIGAGGVVLDWSATGATPDLVTDVGTCLAAQPAPASGC